MVEPAIFDHLKGMIFDLFTRDLDEKQVARKRVTFSGKKTYSIPRSTAKNVNRHLTDYSPAEKNSV
jgi:hypothetical protein